MSCAEYAQCLLLSAQCSVFSGICAGYAAGYVQCSMFMFKSEHSLGTIGSVGSVALPSDNTGVVRQRMTTAGNPMVVGTFLG